MPASFCIFEPATFMTPQAMKLSPPTRSSLSTSCLLYTSDIVPYKKLRGAWRTVYVALMVISAMVTPDASPVTMLLMFAALLVLYEGSLLISRIVLGKRIKKQNEELAREEAEEEELKQEMLARKKARAAKK